MDFEYSVHKKVKESDQVKTFFNLKGEKLPLIHSLEFSTIFILCISCLILFLNVFFTCDWKSILLNSLCQTYCADQ